jgi:hypothetical protein
VNLIRANEGETCRELVDRMPSSIGKELTSWVESAKRGSDDWGEPASSIIDDFYIVENVEDLRVIGQWAANLTDRPMIFDQCRWLPAGDYVFVAVSGSMWPPFFIPAAFVTDNVRLSIAITAEAWGDDEPVDDPDYDRKRP